MCCFGASWGQLYEKQTPGVWVSTFVLFEFLFGH